VDLDGRPAGVTPANLEVAPGDHKITIRASGFLPWSRTLTAGPEDSPAIHAELEPLRLEGVQVIRIAPRSAKK
jgi:hypothetical protein